jgi:hypothetical protein
MKFAPILFLFAVVSCAQTANPKITLTKERIYRSDHAEMKRTGFTPNSNVYSHLRRPDGTEFPVLPMRTDDHGEFTNDIDSLLLSPGKHELWVEDEKSKKTSNVARFEVTSEKK